MERLIQERLTGGVVGLSILIFFAILGGVGALSFMLSELPYWVHLAAYVFVGVVLATVAVQIMRKIDLGEPIRFWVVAGIAIFILMVSISDIIISGMGYVGAVVPRVIPGGLVGGLTEAGTATLTLIIAGPILGMLLGRYLTKLKWGMPKISVAVAVLVVGFLFFITMLGQVGLRVA